MRRQFYHVAPLDWTPGDDLVSWSVQETRGWVTESDWKWPDAPVGYDGEFVCLFATRADADEFRAKHGGQVLLVTITEQDVEDGWELTQVDEGYDAIRWTIPARMVSVA